LFGIVQGGLDPKLRSICLDALIQRNLPGYAIGGLSGGEEKEKFWRIVDQCTDRLPVNKPRYCMGVGYPVDLVVCVAMGVDMFDCVYPTRTARFGTALVSNGTMRLKSDQYRFDFEILDDKVDCMVTNRFSRAYLHQMATKEEVRILMKKSNLSKIGGSLLSYYNIRYLLNLMSEMRHAIKAGSFPKYVQNFMAKQFPQKNYPNWVVEALGKQGLIFIKINTECRYKIAVVTYNNYRIYDF
jgi:tRNA-guanine family transglycosylase